MTSLARLTRTKILRKSSEVNVSDSEVQVKLIRNVFPSKIFVGNFSNYNDAANFMLYFSLYLFIVGNKWNSAFLY
jgi:hypothetical protein